MATSHSLVLRFEFDGTAEDFDALIALEGALSGAFHRARCGTIDGHDIDPGGGEFRIFVLRPEQDRAVAAAVAYVDRVGGGRPMVIEKHYVRSGREEVIWPKPAPQVPG